jgi:hypothetical protein
LREALEVAVEGFGDGVKGGYKQQQPADKKERENVDVTEEYHSLFFSERLGSHTPDLRASVDLGMIVELLQHFQLRGGSRVVMQPLVRYPFTCPPSLALEEDYLSAACPPPQIASAPRARPGREP